MFALMIGDDWYPIIGDPTWIGWFTVAAYFGAAILAWRALGLESQAASSRKFWKVFTIILIFLGFNKQLDLQTWMTTIAKKLAKAQGWYDHRRVPQIVFIGLVFLAGLAIFFWFVWMARGAFRRHWIALAGGVYLGVFIMVRATSFHRVDELLGMEFAGFRMNWILELGGIFWIASCAAQNLWSGRVQQREKAIGREQPPLADPYSAGGT